jgi:REP element-mobilizing transposase RayT
MTADPPNGPERKLRLQRLERIFARSPIYFLTACSFHRKSFLATPAIHSAFLQFATDAENHGAYVGRYTIMPDHIHFFVALEPEVRLSPWMKSLKNSLSKALRVSGQPAPHWQKGFFDHVLRSAESYSQKWDYVRDNPVRAGLVLRWEDWPYSGEIFMLHYD